MNYFIERLKSEISKAVAEQINQSAADIPIEKANPKFGADLAVVLFKFGSKDVPPPELAKQVAENLTHEAIEKTEAIAGFVNIWLKPSFVAQQLFSDVAENASYGNNDLNKGQEVITEFTDPNAFKPVHIGHAYSNTIGEAVSRLLEASGATVHRTTYGGDVGMHAAKAIWGIKQLEKDEGVTFKELSVDDRAPFLGRAYARGGVAFEEDNDIQAEIKEINQIIYEESDPEIAEMHRLGIEWSYDYFEKIYARLDVTFERHYRESETLNKGRQMVEQGLEQGVFEENDGAVIFRGEEHGLHTRVFINNKGLLTYEAKDLGLQFLKEDEYHYDRSIIFTGKEQTEYFKVMLKASDLLQPETANKTTHIPHGLVTLSSGKMSSRTGDVITAESLLDSVEEQVREANPDAPAATQNALAAYKYAMLKQTIGQDVIYDVEESLDFQGNSGPYLQYAAVRVGSILSKTDAGDDWGDYDWVAEKSLLNLLVEYPEVVDSAVQGYEPHLICNFAYELAREMNRYYEDTPVRDANDQERAARVQLLTVVRSVFAHVLNLLNISIPQQM